jgi:hypothetical protein
MNFERYWERGGASKLRSRSSSRDVKEAAREIWKRALKFGRTDNNYNDLSFPEYWNAEKIGEHIDEKNKGRFFFKIDKAAMEEVWNDALELGDAGGSFRFSSTNNHFIS